MTVFGGSYYENTRIQGESSRLHGTGGIEGKFWFVTTGYGIDLSSNYQNHLFSIGIDVFKGMEMLKLIPRAWHAPRGGWFPNPFYLSDEGLARPLVKDWHPQGPDMNPIKIGLNIPHQINEEIKKFTKPKPSKKPKSSTRGRKKSPQKIEKD